MESRHDRPGNEDLWRRLDEFRLDDAEAQLSFSKRLARENDWSHRYALRVVDEYKRFVFLAMTAGHEVTPSDEVDQAWHLHLTYTRSYWDELCGVVLKQPLHHGPTKGGSSEGNRFESQYERTLASYRRAFGAEPPADIWPTAEVRFGEAASFVRVNKHRNFIVQKPWRSRRGPALALLGVAGVGVIGPAQGAKLDAFNQVPWFWITLGIVALMIVFRLIKGGGGGSSCGGFLGCGGGGDSGCGSSGCGGGGCGGGCGGG